MNSFPYQKSVNNLYFPLIEFFVFHKQNVMRVSALIDSGATISIFKEDVAKQLGIDIEKGGVIHLGGVGGHIKGYIHELKVEVASQSFICPIVFSREYTVSFNLLGRDAFFEQFAITFEEKKQRVTLT